MIHSPRFWMFLPVVLLLGSVGLGVLTIKLATSDPSFAVEEDFYEKAKHVDERLAQEEAQRLLGWQVAVDAGPIGSALGRTPVEFTVVGADREPVGGLAGRLEAFHNARAADTLDARLEPVPGRPGVYFADLPLDRTGQWIWRYEFTRGEDLVRGEARSMVGEDPR